MSTTYDPARWWKGCSIFLGLYLACPLLGYLQFRGCQHTTLVIASLYQFCNLMGFDMEYSMTLPPKKC